MSYLNALRLHFAGKFQANVSTVNNDPGHFDNATFQPSYQQMQNQNGLNGWFNPQGDATFRFLGCAVTAAWLPSGQVTNDPVLTCIIADSDTQAPAKLVDLDTEQQLVSEIWGLQVRIADANGNTLMTGDFEPAAFIDIWDRTVGQLSGGDQDAGAAYQSVLCNLQWGDVSKSTFLTKLQQAAADGMLSIKFNVDSINMSFNSPDFMCGRIVGTIGPAAATEPKHMVLGRQFMACGAAGQYNFFFPCGGINFFPAVVDSQAGCVFLDLGNALTTQGSFGPPSDLGDLQLMTPNPSGPPPILLGTIPSQGNGGYASEANWYAQTAGVVALPLTADQISSISASPLFLASANNALPNAVIGEWTSGAFLRADTYVYRLSPDDTVQIPVYATQFGQPLPNVSVTFTQDPSQLQPSNDINPNEVPPVATPPGALTFPTTVTTDANGVATLALTVSDPGTPRYFNGQYGIDGQVYGIRPSFTNPMYGGGPTNQWNFISILLWSGFAASDPVTWSDVEPIFTQYGNLYPVMLRFLNLGDYDSVVANAGLLTLAFGLDPSNPNAMPVTRDLSPAKRQAILAFLANPQPSAKPAAPMLRAAAAVPPPGPSPERAMATRKGGKSAAAARRMVVQSAKGAAS